MKPRILSLPFVLFVLGANAQVSAGDSHSLFRCSSGAVMVCGSNMYGQLGVGIGSNYPAQVAGLTGITAVATGYMHSLFLKNDSTVWGCGLNASGELGDGTTTNRNIPVQVSGLTGITAVAAGNGHSLFLKNDGTVWACGWNNHGQLGTFGFGGNEIHPVQVRGLRACSKSFED